MREFWGIEGVGEFWVWLKAGFDIVLKVRYEVWEKVLVFCVQVLPLL